MFYPECKAEYRLGFTHCPDCDVDLVEALRRPSSGAGNDVTGSSFETIKNVWFGQDEHRCVSLCKQLKAAGIPFKVDQRRHQYLLRVDERYTISVPPEFFDAARKVVIRGYPDSPDGEDDE